MSKMVTNQGGRTMAPFFQGPIAGAGPGARVQLWKRGIELDETAPVWPFPAWRVIGERGLVV